MTTVREKLNIILDMITEEFQKGERTLKREVILSILLNCIDKDVKRRRKVEMMSEEYLTFDLRETLEKVIHLISVAFLIKDELNPFGEMDTTTTFDNFIK